MDKIQFLIHELILQFLNALFYHEKYVHLQGIDGANITSPGSVKAEYTAKFATTPEIGLTSANFALYNFLANFIHSNSTSSM